MKNPVAKALRTPRFKQQIVESKKLYNRKNKEENMLDTSDIEYQEMILNLLNIGIIEVTFTKVDGTERVLKCTLKKSLLPEEDTEEDLEVIKKDVNPNTCIVWDVENQGWRSFKWSSIIEVVV